MGKKLGLSSFLLKLRDHSSSPSLSSISSSSSFSWYWPSCKNPKTDSFRDVDGEAIYKNVMTNSAACFDSTDSCITRSSEELESFSTSSEKTTRDDSLETVMRGLRSDRLFFDPGSTSCSIMEEVIKAGGREVVEPFKSSVVLAMESEDPCRDFRLSMEEMVAAHRLRDWERLEELLVWYLRLNEKKTHGFIVGAFADLVLGLASPSSSNSFETKEIKDDEEIKCTVKLTSL